MQTKAVKKNKVIDFIKNIPPVVYILIVMVGVFSMFSPSYFQFSNLQNILVQSVPLMLVAFAQTLIVLTQGTDLSLGAQVSLVTVVWVLFMQMGIPSYIAAIIATAFSMMSGAINGLIVSKWKIPPFIATLGMQNILYSVALLITSGSSIYHEDPIFRTIAETDILGISLMVWITALLFLMTWMLLNKTKLGAIIFGLGGNPEALSLAGINVVKSSILIYAIAGFLTAMSGLLTTCRLESGQPIVGQGWEFEAVAAVLLGGSSLREGKGGVGGTIFGVLLITILKNGLNVVGLFSIYQNAIIGIIILAAIVIDNILRRIKNN